MATGTLHSCAGPVQADRANGRGLIGSMPLSWPQLALVVWTVLLAVICGRVLLNPNSHSVLPIFTTGGQRFLDGANLYDPLPQLDFYRYSPTFAVLMAPFHLLPERLAALLWRLLNAGVFLAGLAWWLRTLPWPLTAPQKAGIFLLVIPLSLGSINNGQSNPLLCGLMLATVAGVAGQRWNLAAGCIAAASLIKIYPLALGMLLALVYLRPFLPRMLLALTIGLLLPFCFQEPHYVAAQYGNWVEHLQGYDRQSMPMQLWYRDVRLLCGLWGTPLSPGVFLGVQLAAAAALAALVLAGQLRGCRPQELLLLVLCLSCGWIMAFGPATESCTFILLAPPLAWLLLATWVRGESWRWPFTLAYALLVLAQVAIVGRAWLRHHGIQPTASLIFLACLIARNCWAASTNRPEKKCPTFGIR